MCLQMSKFNDNGLQLNALSEGHISAMSERPSVDPVEVSDMLSAHNNPWICVFMQNDLYTRLLIACALACTNPCTHGFERVIVC